ncbi:hypothetical protein M0R04_11410 [Candidatus Dojkabacteria bacterium]|jgi:hypothetical protein|nr:hypothetical protein [Candidatus Dojkabacteria bacterium]
MITVNKDTISKFNPCNARFDKYLKYYDGFNGTIEEFLDLSEITYSEITYDDKIWVARRLLNKNQLIHFAVLCAQSVLHIYENKYLKDNRVKDCLEYLITITDFSNLSNEQEERLSEVRDAAYAAAADAYDDAEAYAAYGAYAAYAADATYAVAAAATYADTAYAAYAVDATYDAADAYAAAATYAAAADSYTDAKTTQQNLNLQFLKVASNL